MTIAEIKKAMKAYRDYYGGDLLESGEIDNATTKKELAKIIEKHRAFMEDMLCDAFSHLDDFKNKVGLTTI
jgi:hypothetical protein